MNRPKPTALRIVQGNPGKRPPNKREPKPRVGEPEMPSHLSAEAREHWKRFAPVLTRIGCLTEADGVAFEGLCEAYQSWVDAKKAKAETGVFATSPNGYLQPSPAVGIERAALKQLMSIAGEFGMTPSSRSKVKTDGPAQEADPFDELLKGA
jgi:P27 family predicted phage terminase small subunit